MSLIDIADPRDTLTDEQRTALAGAPTRRKEPVAYIAPVARDVAGS